MPWCTECDRFLSPASVVADGTCPTCGLPVDPGHAHVAGEALTEAAGATSVTDHAGTEEELPPIPWHLKALAAAAAIYLGFRSLQIIEWVAHRLSG